MCSILRDGNSFSVQFIGIFYLRILFDGDCCFINKVGWPEAHKFMSLDCVCRVAALEINFILFDFGEAIVVIDFSPDDFKLLDP